MSESISEVGTPLRQIQLFSDGRMVMSSAVQTMHVNDQFGNKEKAATSLSLHSKQKHILAKAFTAGVIG